MGSRGMAFGKDIRKSGDDGVGSRGSRAMVISPIYFFKAELGLDVLKMVLISESGLRVEKSGLENWG